MDWVFKNEPVSHNTSCLYIRNLAFRKLKSLLGKFLKHCPSDYFDFIITN